MNVIKNQCAQGDVLFRRVPQLPQGVTEQKSKGDPIVAHSETGHHHVARAPGKVRMFEADDNPLICYLVAEGVEYMDMVHLRAFDTHGTVRLDASGGSVWEVRRQREYVPGGWRRVED